MKVRPMCRHCCVKQANRPLGLCWCCYYTPGVRALYPSESKHGRHQQDFNGGYEEDEQPLPGPPGSLERIESLAARVQKHVRLFRKGGD